MLGVMGGDLLEAQEGEEEVLVGICGLGFGCDGLRGDGEVEVIVCASAVLIVGLG